MSARDDYGFLITPKNSTYWGYEIRSFEANGATEYDVYFGRRLMGTFPSVAAAKTYIEQPLKGE